MKNLIQEVAKKYSLKSVEEQIDKLSNNLTLSIGFLGEFSSGKSTLINALIGKKVLPAMEKPTTKSVIEIIPTKEVESLEYYEKDDNEDLIPIEPLDFQEIALGRRDGTGVIKVKPSEILQDGYFIVDTPGISSLEKTDIDITYGYLPFLDGAVICQDVNYGSLTDSVLSFISKPSVKPIVNNFIFALTKADTKPEASVEEIRKHIIDLLLGKAEDLGINTSNLEDRVVAVSGLKALEENKDSYVEELKGAFKTVILNRKKSMLKAKENKELISIGEKTIEILSNMKDNLKLTDDEIDKKEEEIKKEIKKLEEEKEQFIRKFESYKDKICKRLNGVAERYIPAFESITDAQEAENVINEFVNEVSSITEAQTKGFMDGIQIPNLKYIGEGLKSSVKNTIKQIDVGVLVTTSLLFAWIAPGAGAADAAQAGGAGLAQKSSEIAKAIQTTSKITKVSNALEKTSEIVSKSESVGGKLVNVFGKALEVIGEIEKNINPLEYVGDYLKQTIVSNKAKSQLYRIAYNVCDEVTSEVEQQIRDTVFSKLESSLDSQEQAIEYIRKERLNKIEEMNKKKAEIENDIVEIKNASDQLRRL